MSVNSVQTTASGERWNEGDEIDLRRYVQVLGSRWLEILLITVGLVLLTAAGVLVYRAVAQPVYEATATAAIVRTLTDVRFDDRFTTSSDQPNMDVNSRRAALVSMVESGDVAQAVIAKLGDQLSPEERNPADLLEMVSGQMASINGRAGQSDLINITVKADTPEKAALIATAWAQAYVDQVNRVYGQVPDELLASVNNQLKDADTAYRAAQANLESAYASSQLEALKRQLQARQATISVLERGKVQALDAYVSELTRSYERIVSSYLEAQTANQVLAFSKQQEGLRARITAYLDAYNAAQVDTFTGQSDRNRAELRMYYDQWLRTTSALATARTLRDQLDTSGDTATPATALALQVLKIQLVNATSRLPLPLNQLYLSPDQLANRFSLPGAQTVTVNEQRSTSIPNDATNPTTPEYFPSRLTTQTTQSASQPTMETESGMSLQVQLDGNTAVSAAELRADLDATVTSLESQLASLENDIAALNQSMLSGDRFDSLNATMPDNSNLVKAIQEAYPALFETSIFSTTVADATAGSSLLAAGQAQAGQLLTSADATALPTTDAPNSPMAETMAQLEEEVRQLNAKVETETARELQAEQQRDLTWESFKALSSKQAELTLARAAGNSEVRMSSIAVPPVQPVDRVSLVLSVMLAAIVGLLLGILVAFLLAMLDVPPLRQRRAGA